MGVKKRLFAFAGSLLLVFCASSAAFFGETRAVFAADSLSSSSQISVSSSTTGRRKVKMAVLDSESADLDFLP